MSDRPLAVVTGASSGIGAASARELAKAGFEVVLGARRADRLAEVAADCGGTAVPLDVTDSASVASFVDRLDRCDLLVNNAGGAFGLEEVAEADLEAWRRMYEVNVLGWARVAKALLPLLIASGDGQVVTIGSIAGHEAYPGGAGYNAAKFGEAAITRALRLELLGRPVRVCEIDPGMVETEFSLVRFSGDGERADAVYEGMTPLTAEDVAEAVAWVATRPARVNIDQITMMPRDQAGARIVHRADLRLRRRRREPGITRRSGSPGSATAPSGPGSPRRRGP
ncbi:SDR family NAD(P)-dependent oxidoreductase [Glycomyces salinus]|uniref:SDR family NAD(P)-dependent oxidoreductase n=1 Tax=Glycomyces salinus TaxID=980294 RepID=UPI0018EA8389|nr:SDR family NAD(P)-dependent oxidoreductase [Glycomyces salinus]